MTQISRLRSAEIANGNLINADDISAELNGLVSESNAQDLRITELKSGNVTITGNKAYSGTANFSGAVTLSSTVSVTGTLKIALASDPGVPLEGMIWSNTTSHLLKWYNGTTTKTLATTSDINSMLPSQTSNSGKFLTTNGTTASWASTAFSAYNLSSNITIVTAGAWSVTHGLGQAPKGIQLYLKCLTAELGYTIGDMYLISSDQVRSTSDTGAGATINTGNTTTINGRFGNTANTFFVLHKTTGTVTAITQANWALVVASWA